MVLGFSDSKDALYMLLERARSPGRVAIFSKPFAIMLIGIGAAHLAALTPLVMLAEEYGINVAMVLLLAFQSG